MVQIDSTWLGTRRFPLPLGASSANIKGIPRSSLPKESFINLQPVGQIQLDMHLSFTQSHFAFRFNGCQTNVLDVTPWDLDYKHFWVSSGKSQFFAAFP
ncbi:hypothetical protein TNIN_70891 [Trichonephila inaurata madagascariensis]|uniref:Uncharacterized protein n=1 Tax=Trichonephila inaurata madagascariensis TaxID=2747483 RepID=A0A8X6WXH0_9ARAC|nr:hypothetical protein TNIN_70891 [Trichonephila inaurata madagascariensis]